MTALWSSMRYLVQLEGSFLQTEDDRDIAGKIICVCALRADVGLVFYQTDRDCRAVIETINPAPYARELKRILSQVFSVRLGKRSILRGVPVKLQKVDASIIPPSHKKPSQGIPVGSLPRDLRREIMHTNLSLEGCRWLLDANLRLIPESVFQGL